MEKSYTPARITPARTIYNFTSEDLANACRVFLTQSGERVPFGREHLWGLEYDREFCFVVDEEEKSS